MRIVIAAMSLLLQACQHSTPPKAKLPETMATPPTVSTAVSASRKAAPFQLATTQPTAEPSGDFIRFERGPCYGHCPVYTATLTPDDKVRLKQASDGEQQLRSRVAFNTVKAVLLRLQFFRLAERYEPSNKKLCPQYATDHPSSQITARLNGHYHQVYHYHGCTDFTDQATLVTLEQQLEQQLQLPLSNLQ